MTTVSALCNKILKKGQIFKIAADFQPLILQFEHAKSKVARVVMAHQLPCSNVVTLLQGYTLQLLAAWWFSPRSFIK